MKPLTPNQKKAAWIIAAVLVIVHFAPALINTVRLQFTNVHAAAHDKPSPYVPMPAPATAAIAPSAANVFMQTHAGYIGVWKGTELMPNQDMCNLQLELRWSDKKQGEFVGYLTRQCAPLMTAHSNDISNVIRNVSPVSGILSGPMVNDAIQLHLDTAIGVPPNGCQLTNYTVRQFGEQIAASWDAGTCPAGQMMLSKTRG
jgi:hypothetical protein